MTARISRRAVFAQVLLTAAPKEIRVRQDGELSVEFDTVAELQQWVTDSGLRAAEPSMVHGERTTTNADGSLSRHGYAYPDNFHGWKVYATSLEYIVAAPLDDATRAELAAVAGDGVPC